MSSKEENTDIDRIIEEAENAPPEVPDEFMINELRFFHGHDRIVCALKNGVIVHVPISKYSKLKRASQKDREQFKLLGDGAIVQWEGIGLTLSAEGIINEYLQNSSFQERLRWQEFHHQLQQAHKERMDPVLQRIQEIYDQKLSMNTDKEIPLLDSLPSVSDKGSHEHGKDLDLFVLFESLIKVMEKRKKGALEGSAGSSKKQGS